MPKRKRPFSWVDAYNIVHPKKRAFLEAFARCGNVSRATEAIKIGCKTHYDWLNREYEDKEEYAAAFKEAKERAFDVLEAEARRRAVEGVEEPVYREGRCVGTVTKYSDLMLIFLMKGMRPDIYRDNYQVQHTGPNGADLPNPITNVNIMLNVQELVRTLNGASPADLAALERLAAHRLGSQPRDAHDGNNGPPLQG